MKNQRGFSIIEMVVTLALIGIIARTMVTSLADFQESFAQNNSRYTLDSDLRRLRTEAVSKGAQGILTVSADGTSYSAGLDYFPFSTTNTPDTTLFVRNLPSMITLATGRNILFNSRGYVSDGAGSTTTVLVTLRLKGNAYYSATLYSTGALS